MPEKISGRWSVVSDRWITGVTLTGDRSITGVTLTGDRRTTGATPARVQRITRDRLATVHWPLATLVLVLVLAACAPRLVPAPVVTAPAYPDFVFPAVPPALQREPLTLRQQRGWQFLQAGDLDGARREFRAALQAAATFYPADAGLAYASLAGGAAPDALARFDHVLKRDSRYVPALVGRGDALAQLGRADEAVASFEAALAVDATLADAKRRIEALAFRAQQQTLETARKAAEAGRVEDAVAAYQRAIAASPESGFLYRELAALERKHDRAEAALGHLEQAVALDPSDARSWAQIGELLEQSGDFPGAVSAYEKARAVEPGPDLDARLTRARQGAELARLPAEYRDIANANELTRGQLAALLGVRLATVLRESQRREGVVLTDVRGHWAATWIMAAVRAGVMEPLPNHAFAPRGLVRRLDLAQVASRVLNVIAVRRPALARQWQSTQPRVADVPAAHLGYPAVAAVVAAGAMPLESGAFRPSRVVTGAEAVDVVGRLEVLAR
ncbi:MAG: hypothetical protein EHM24_29945 [Acidobacteria bacterium]|nr:MAG: hypothetical protein EHM24_29945 [Acidobacteriota bacterium]